MAYVSSKAGRELRDKAFRYRLLAATITDSRAVNALREIATEYEEVADKLERKSATPEAA
jgi:hypothetical protein